MTHPDEFHIFSLHSHIVYLVAKAVIRERGLDPRRCAFVLTRDYQTPKDADGIPRHPFPFPNWDLSFYCGKNHEKIRANIRNIEKFIDRITGERDFHYYVQHTRSYYVNIIASYEKCIDYSFLEEGNTVYLAPKELASIKLNRIPPRNDRDMILSNASRLRTFDSQFFNTTHPRFGQAFGVSPDSFPMVPEDKRRCLADVFQEAELKESEKGDAILAFGNDRWAQLSKSLCIFRYEKMLNWFIQNVLVAKGYRRVLYKLRNDAAPSDRNLYTRLFRNHPEIEFVQLDESFVLENVIKTLDVPVYIISSSCGLYARQMGRKVYSLARLYRHFDPGYAKMRQWGTIEFLDRSGVEFIEYTEPKRPEKAAEGKVAGRKVYGFDVYDTLITRKVATPSGIFTLVQDRLRKECRAAYPSELVENFCYFRKLAEHSCYTVAGEGEITLEKIYRKLHGLFHYVDRPKIERIMQMEIEEEIRWTVPIEENIERIRRLLERNERVVLISDMYLPEAVLRSILDKADPILKKCKLYLSSSVGLKKTRRGRLFQHVCKQEGILPENLWHVGDNESADFKIPQSLGIGAAKYKRSELHHVERSYLVEKTLFHQLIAGVSRRFRIVHPKASSLADVGAMVTAPILYGFVDDTLKKAAARGIKTLYFSGRGGRILLEIAEIVNETGNWNLNLRLLHCSGPSLLPAGIIWTNTEIYDWLFDRFPRSTFRDVAKRLRLDAEELSCAFPAEVREILPDFNVILDKEALDLLKKHLCKTIAVRALIEGRAKRLRELFLDYLKQEGVFDDETVGVVDIGWEGLVQNTFFKIAASRKPGFKMLGFSFIASPDEHHGYSHANVRENYIETILPGTESDPAFLADFMETLCCPNHGTTVDYEKTKGEKIVPVFGENVFVAPLNIREYHDALLWWTKEYANLEKQLPGLPFPPKAILRKLLSNCSDPHPDVAEAFGSLELSGQQNSRDIRELAPVLGVCDVLRYYLTKDGSQKVSRWMSGSLARSPRFVQGLSALLAWAVATDAVFFEPHRKQWAQSLGDFFKGKTWKTLTSPFIWFGKTLGGLADICASGMIRLVAAPIRKSVLPELKGLEESENHLVALDLDMVSLYACFSRTGFAMQKLEEELQILQNRVKNRSANCRQESGNPS